MLAWIDRYGLASTRQVMRHWFGTPGQLDGASAARRRIRYLTDAGLLATTAPLFGQPPVVTATRLGARLVGSELPLAHLALTEVIHDLAVLDLSRDLTSLYAGSAWLTEREVRHGLPKFTELLHHRGEVPDGILVLASERRVAIEYDRTPKSSARYRSLVEGHLRSMHDGLWEEVWWVVDATATAHRIRAAIDEERANDVASVVLRTHEGERVE